MDKNYEFRFPVVDIKTLPFFWIGYCSIIESFNLPIPKNFHAVAMATEVYYKSMEHKVEDWLLKEAITTSIRYMQRTANTLLLNPNNTIETNRHETIAYINDLIEAIEDTIADEDDMKKVGELTRNITILQNIINQLKNE